MDKVVKICIVDDEFPKVPKYTDVYGSVIESEIIKDLVENYSDKWQGIQPLRNLLKGLLLTDAYKKGLLDLLGYSEPPKILDDIDKNGLLPDFIVYDWEYGARKASESESWLLEILKKTEATIYVYSHVRDNIPDFLNKSIFDEYSTRFKLLLKGGENSYIFSSEEFINQSVMSVIGSENTYKLRGNEIVFEKNDYLKNIEEISLLEKILNKDDLLNKVSEKGNLINNENIEIIISELKQKVLFDRDKGVLFMDDSPIFKMKFNANEELTSLNVLKNYGLTALLDLFDVGLTKI